MRIRDIPERPARPRVPLDGAVGSLYSALVQELLRKIDLHDSEKEKVKGQVPLQHKQMYSVTPLPKRPAKPPLPIDDTMGVTRPNPPPNPRTTQVMQDLYPKAFSERWRDPPRPSMRERWESAPRLPPSDESVALDAMFVTRSIQPFSGLAFERKPPPSGFIEVVGAHGIKTLVPRGTSAIQLDSILKEIEAQAPVQETPQYYQDAKRRVWEENEFWSKGWRVHVRKEERWILEGTKHVHDLG